jgi:uncharacterized membrane protein
MKYKTVKIIEIIMSVFLPVMLAVTVIFNIWYLPLIFLVIGLVAFAVMTSRLKEIYQDEMTKTIEEKGARVSMSIGPVLMVIVGVILLALAESNTSSLGIAAITLFATSFGMNLLNVFTKIYYRKKLGGK